MSHRCRLSIPAACATAGLLAVSSVSAAPPSVSAEPIAVDQELVQPWLNANLIQWDTDAIKHHRLAQALGYDQVCDIRDLEGPGRSLATAEHSHGLGFYISDPHKNTQPHMSLKLSEADLKKARRKYAYTFSRYPELPRAIDNRDFKKMQDQDPAWFEALKQDFERTKAWANDKREFPMNLAELQSWGKGERWEPAPDFQQQSVIDEHVAATVDYIRQVEDNDFDYTFTGIIIDVIEQWDGFSWNSSRPLPGEPATERYAVAHPGVTHDYQTFREGWYVYLGALRDALEAQFPQRTIRFIWEPTPIVPAWVEPLNDVPYASFTPTLREKIMGDALLDEKPGLQYLIDPEMQPWPPHRRGTASGDLFAKAPHYPTQLVYFGEISSRTGYFMSYGNFDRARRPLEAYENQFKLIRALSAWQNQHGTPRDQRTWDGEQNIYASPTAYADEHGLAGVHPKQPAVYASLLDADARIHLAPGVTLSDFKTINEYWEPQATQFDVEVVDGVLQPTADAEFPVHLIARLSTTTPRQRVFTTAPGLQLAQDYDHITVPNSKLLNPGFENGNEGWSGTGEARAQIVDQPVASGNAAVRVSHRIKLWNALEQDVTGVLMNTRQGPYRVAARFRSESGPAEFGVRIQINENGEKTTFRTEPVKAPAGQWVQLDQVIDLDWGDWVARADFYLERLDSQDDYFVDEVTFEFVP